MINAQHLHERYSIPVLVILYVFPLYYNSMDLITVH